MLKRFVWKENDIYSIRLKKDQHIPVQLLAKPYAVFFDLTSRTEDFEGERADLNDVPPLGICMVLKDFFKTCAEVKLNGKFMPRANVPLPERFISPDPQQWLRRSAFEDRELVYNLVRIDPALGDQGIMGNEIVRRDVPRNDRSCWENREMVGYNTGYELIRRLILSLESGRWIDPAKEKARTGEDPYPLRTLEEMWEAGVPKYR
ncbi:hypothetical protein [Saccharibacillus alkalitolerans]|uniref:Uncharacterized protein n=1 Tax=Saccharibacillus alkalitolerans TaxID=2705290 RepID=A0ABX0EZ84_9BACL|nr:hypothetical protein [Saccharibacillus alkalitolerans]NGZ73951.1 hypothetical protein [Saccharibacillus alkalitolerans]